MRKPPLRVIKDTSGAVMPGVTVEASSPVLIEKSRSVVTDGTGQYRIVDLRPGAYTVTFTLSGFSTVKREGVELTGSFTATVNGELRVGALEETITVSGETPLVDVQSVSRQRVFANEVVDTIPTAKIQYNLAVLIPGVSMGGGVTQQDVGGSAGLEPHTGWSSTAASWTPSASRKTASRSTRFLLAGTAGQRRRILQPFRGFESQSVTVLDSSSAVLVNAPESSRSLLCEP
jgi:hypothetical protein